MTVVRALKPLRYLNRMLQVGDEFEAMPGDVRWATARGRAEIVGDAPQRPVRPNAHKDIEWSAKEPDPTTAESEVPEPTREELLARAAELGVELPSGYVPKATLVELVGKAEKEGVR